MSHGDQLLAVAVTSSVLPFLVYDAQLIVPKTSKTMRQHDMFNSRTHDCLLAKRTLCYGSSFQYMLLNLNANTNVNPIPNPIPQSALTLTSKARLQSTLKFEKSLLDTGSRLLIALYHFAESKHNSRTTTHLNSTENYGRRCLTPLSPHHYYILS